MSKLTVTLPDDLHQQIRLELERQGITTAQFIELAVHNFFEQQKEGTHMATRTMAFQVSEELFQRIKEYLSRFEQVYHRKLTQKEFMLKSRWYQGNDGSNDHYDLSRYHAVNLHSVFYHGTVEFRLFNATLHAGEVKANIVLAMAISAQAINQQKTLAHKTPIGDNPAFTFRTFLLRLGLIGPEYKNVREHLLKNLPGDRAWRYDKAQYPCNQRHRDDGAR